MEKKEKKKRMLGNKEQKEEGDVDRKVNARLNGNPWHVRRRTFARPTGHVDRLRHPPALQQFSKSRTVEKEA